MFEKHKLDLETECDFIIQSNFDSLLATVMPWIVQVKKIEKLKPMKKQMKLADIMALAKSNMNKLEKAASSVEKEI